MTNVTLIDKARRGRMNAIASLNGDQMRTDNIVSIFENAFDAPAQGKVTGLRPHRAGPVVPRRIAA